MTDSGQVTTTDFPSEPLNLHASSVAVNGGAVLIIGPSGSGKSALALQLMALGAGLISDDRTLVRRKGDGVMASCPDALTGLIEARGVGILKARPVAGAPIRLIVDLGRLETERLPPRRHHDLLGVSIELVFGIQASHFPAAILHYIKGGRAE